MNPVLMQEMQAVLKAIIRKEISSKVAIGSTVLTVDEQEIIVKIRSLQKYEKSIQKIINKSEGKQSSNVVSEWHVMLEMIFLLIYCFSIFVLMDRSL